VNENVNLIRLMASYNSNTLKQLTWFLCKKYERNRSHVRVQFSDKWNCLYF